jgi:hypothetical protein
VLGLSCNAPFSRCLHSKGKKTQPNSDEVPEARPGYVLLAGKQHALDLGGCRSPAVGLAFGLGKLVVDRLQPGDVNKALREALTVADLERLGLLLEPRKSWGTLWRARGRFLLLCAHEAFRRMRKLREGHVYAVLGLPPRRAGALLKHALKKGLTVGGIGVFACRYMEAPPDVRRLVS